LHVAYYSPSWPPEGAANGIVTYVRQIRAELLRLGHEVTIISNGTAYFGDGSEMPLDWSFSVAERLLNRSAAILGRPADRLPKRGGLLAGAFAQVHQRRAIDIIEMEESFGWSRELQSRLDIPVVTRLHGPHYLTGADTKLSQRRVAAEGRAIREATALSAPSAALMDTVTKDYGCNAAWRAIISNPVTAAEPESLWRLAECDPRAFLLVGRFDRPKGADVALKAIEMVIEREPEASLTIVGPDNGLDLEDGRRAGFAEYCAARVPEHARRSINFRGVLDRAEIDGLRRRSLATLVCSRFENFPYAILEAMAVGAPVIASDSCKADLVIDRQTGWIVPTGSAEALAERMLWAIANLPNMAATGHAGWVRCRRDYATSVIVPQMVEFYESVQQGFADR